MLPDRMVLKKSTYNSLMKKQILILKKKIHLKTQSKEKVVR